MIAPLASHRRLAGGAIGRRQRRWAMSSGLNAISRPLVRESAPMVARSRNRTVANGDSTTLVVRRCFQSSPGKSKNAVSRACWQSAKRPSRILGLILCREDPGGFALRAVFDVQEVDRSEGDARSCLRPH
jgi:hypothetical protein